MGFIIESGDLMFYESTGRNSGKTHSIQERCIENHLRFYKTYLVGIKNLERQLDYIMPTMIANYGTTEGGSFFFIPNNTENVALTRLESKHALDLKEEIEQLKIITSSIENAVEELTMQERAFVHLRYFECLPIDDVKTQMGYKEEKSIYRIRRHCLNKLVISLKTLLTLK